MEVGGFDLVIFDCDGVLVDSERLAVRVEAEIVTNLGWSLAESDIIERFVGRSAAYMHQEIERHLGRSIDWDFEFEARYREVFETELLPVPGVIDALREITPRRALHRAEVTTGCDSPSVRPGFSIDSMDGSSVLMTSRMASQRPTSFSMPP